MTAPAARRPWTAGQLAVAAAGLLSVALGLALYAGWVTSAPPGRLGHRSGLAAMQLLQGVAWVLQGRLQLEGRRLRRRLARQLDREARS